MARLFLAIFALLIVGSFAIEQEEGVYVLTDDNFDGFVADNEFALIEFYAPWCGHCKNLAPHFSKSALALASEGSDVKLGKVDATVYPDLASKFGVQGYPTIYWFSGAEPSQYAGPREHPGIAQWIAKQTIKTLPVVELQSDLDNFKAAGVVIALYGESSGYDVIVQAAREILDITFVHITNENEFGANVAGDIVLYPTHTGPATIQFTDTEAFIDFIVAKAYAPVVEFSQDNLKRLATNGFAIIAVDDLADESKKTSLINLLNVVAPSRVPGLGFMYGDSTQLARGITGAGATGNVWPGIVAVNFATGGQLTWEESLEFNAENVGVWCDGLLDGTTKPFRKSEPIPEDDGPLKVLVGKNFDSIEGKKVLVKFYAPWCGHCKSLEPIYQELATNFADKDIVIAKIDATANYVEADISGYPTLIYYDGQGNSFKYEGGRTLEDLTEFINTKL